MGLYLHHYSVCFDFIFPKRTWRKNTDEKVIYLTFDDGPIPEVTDFVLDELARHEAKATFFCVGDNIRKNPQVYQRLLDEGHRSGNHTFNHLNGSKTLPTAYLENIEKCSLYIREEKSVKKLFRPPYGRMTREQVRLVAPIYEIVMWDVLSADFDPGLSKERCLNKTIKHTKKGSIVVFHDSVKTIAKLRWVLPRYLAHFTTLGYRFECL